MKLVAKEIFTAAAIESTKILLSSGELIPIVGSFARLLTLGIIACETAKCNRDAFKQLKSRLCTFADLFLGEFGLTRVAKDRGMNDILKKYVRELESIMEEGLKYLNAFTKVGFLSNLMGTRHLQKFSQIDSDLTATVHQLSLSLQMTVLVEQSATYKVVLDIQARIDGQYGGLKNVHSNPKLLQALASEIQCDPADLIIEIQDSLDRIEETVNQVDENVRIIKDAMLGFQELKSDIKTIIEQKQDQLLLLDTAVNPSCHVKVTPIIDKSQVLGRGSFGVIYAAEYLQEEVAVKVIVASSQLNNDLLLELHKEVLMHSKVCHLPGVVKLFGANLQSEPRYIILERASCSLHDALHHREPLIDLSIHSKIGILVQISAALDYIHQLDFIHRDIKSSNILLFLQERGRVIAKLSDFGLAKSNTDNTFALNKSPKGSPPYMSPEAFQGRYSYSTDIYSFGVMMNELLVEERPFAELHTPQEIWCAVIDGRRPTCYEAEDSANLVACRLESLIRVCWSTDEALRQNAHKIHKELMELLKLSVEVTKLGVGATQHLFPVPEGGRIGDEQRGKASVSEVTADAAIRTLNHWLTSKCGLLPADSKAIARSLVNTKRITSLASLVDELRIDENMLSGELGVPRAYETKIKDTLRRDFLKPLADLTVEEVVCLLDTVHMSRYASTIVSHDVTGLVLTSLESVEELVDLGVESRAHGKALMKQISLWQSEGVEIERIKRNQQKVVLPPVHEGNLKESALAELRAASRDDSDSRKFLNDRLNESSSEFGVYKRAYRAQYSRQLSRNNESSASLQSKSSSITTAVAGAVSTRSGKTPYLDRSDRETVKGLTLTRPSEQLSGSMDNPVQHSSRSGSFHLTQLHVVDDEPDREEQKEDYVTTFLLSTDAVQRSIGATVDAYGSTVEMRRASFERTISFSASRLEASARTKIMEVVSRLTTTGSAHQQESCDLVIEALDSVGFDSEPITELGLYALGRLAQRSEENKVYLSNHHHACEMVINLLNKHGFQSPSLADNFVFAIGSLTLHSAANAEKFLANDVAVTLLNILRIHGKSMLSVANCGLTALANLCFDYESRTILGEQGAADVILSLLRHHGPDNVSVAMCGVTCLANMAFNHVGNKTKLGQATACVLVMQLLQKQGESNVSLADHALYACAILTDHNAKNTSDLARLEFCQCLVRMIALYGTTNANIAKYGMHTVNALAMHSKKTCKLFTQTSLAATFAALLHNYCSSVYCNVVVVSKLMFTLHTLLKWQSVSVKRQLQSTDIAGYISRHIVQGYTVTDEEVKQIAWDVLRRLQTVEKKYWFF